MIYLILISIVQCELVLDKSAVVRMGDAENLNFCKGRKVRAILDESAFEWWFSVLDIVAAINHESDYAKTRYGAVCGDSGQSRHRHRRGEGVPRHYLHGRGNDKYYLNAWLFARIPCRRPRLQACRANKISKACYRLIDLKNGII